MRFVEGRERSQPISPSPTDISEVNLSKRPLRKITGGPAEIVLVTALSLACTPAGSAPSETSRRPSPSETIPGGATAGPSSEEIDPNLESNSPSQEVLGVRDESIQQLFNEFYDEYNQQYAEKNDPSNLNQCVDLIYAWIDKLSIPRSSIQNFNPRNPIASQIYTNADDETRNYFDIIPNANGEEPRVGDIIVWDETYFGTGHAAIAYGLNEWLDSQHDIKIFYAFAQNFPKGMWSKVDDYPSSTPILGWLRPKGFLENTPSNQGSLEYERLSDVEKAKFNFASDLFYRILLGGFSYEDENGSYVERDGRIYQNGDEMTSEGIENIISKLVREDEVGELEYRFSRESYSSPNERETSGEKRIGAVFFDELSLEITSIEPVSAADQRNGIDWRGTVMLTGIMSYGLKDFSAGGWERVNTERLKQYFSRLSPGDIDTFSPWMDMEEFTGSFLTMVEPPIAIPAIIEFGSAGLLTNFYTNKLANDENHPDIFELMGFFTDPLSPLPYHPWTEYIEP